MSVGLTIMLALIGFGVMVFLILVAVQFLESGKTFNEFFRKP